MIFIPGELYKLKITYTFFTSYRPLVLKEIKSDTILLFLDYFEYKGDRTVFVKRFLADNTIFMDDLQSLETPERFFESL